MTHAYADATPLKKRELLGKLLQERSLYEYAGPLSEGQRSLWFMYQLDRASPAYNILFAAHLRGFADPEVLRSTLQSLVDRHAILRTIYGTSDGQPLQRVRRHQELELVIVDAHDWSLEELSDQIEHRANAPFDLEHGPVLRAVLFDREGEDVLLLASHHIAMDFWSYDLFMDEFEALYRVHANGLSVPPPPCVNYADYVRRQQMELGGETGDRAWQYWSSQLSKLPPPLDLPTDRPRPPRQTFAGASHRFCIPDTTADGLRRLAESQGATLYATLLAAFFVLLHRYSGQEDILIGSPTAGRNSRDFENVLGYFLNPIVIRARPIAEHTFSQLLTEVRETVVAGLAHQDFPFALLVERLQPQRDASRSPIFQVGFNWDKPRRRAWPKDSDSQLRLEPFAFAQQGAAFDLTMMMIDSHGELAGALQYNTELFDLETIDRMLRHFQVLLAGIVADPNRRLRDLPLFGVLERRLVLEDWNATQAEYPSNSTLPELLEASASSAEDRIAVEHNGNHLTYRELHERADWLAAFLRRRGVGSDAIVALYLPRSLEMVIALVGVLKSGGAYLPMDPCQPPDRLRMMLEDARPHLILTHSELAPALPVHDASVVCLDLDSDISEQTISEGLGPSATDRAYVIYTSGSTGGPKAVQISHRALVNFLTGMAPLLGADDVLAAVTTLSFDISALEIYGPLLAGGRTILIDTYTAADGVRLAECLHNRGVTIMQATPATWRLLLRAGWTGGKHFKALCGGDVLPPILAQQLLEHCGQVWNLYGPTETTVWSTIHKVEHASERPSVPIGRPIANTQLYILDSSAQPVPVGVAGELYIGGDGLADGYLNRPELTREKFVPHPFADSGRARLYRTGDIARYLADGNVEFLGRRDHQVKVNGYRIELAEIESELARCELVREAVVVARDDRESGAKRLVAYVAASEILSGRSDAHGSDQLTVTALREFLSKRLPGYMLPSKYVFLSALPLTPNGKVDRSALPEPDDQRPTLAQSYLAPRDDLEFEIAKVWSRVLNLDPIGIADNFFELGGASAEALEVIANLENVGITMHPSALFEYQTISEFADAVRRHGAAETQPVSPLPTELPNDGVEKQGASPCRLPPATAAVSEFDSSSNMIIESLGVYLPERSVSTEEVLAGCHREVAFPLEQMTGIRSRRVTDGTEFSIDLARNAIAECLRRSRYTAREIDLLICCSISRCEGPGRFVFEPCTAVKLRKDCGFEAAIAFDVSNACAGMFTGIMLADAMLKTGQIRRAMIVSGEYISHLIDSAQREIAGFMDPRLACLTVGDAGAAVIVERSAEAGSGFHDIDMYTLGKYSSLCIAKISDQSRGSAIMYTDPIKQTAVAAKNAVMHSKNVIERCGWPLESFDRVIMHQTSETALRDVARALDREFGRPVCHDGNMVYNVAERGNTATTSHFVALDDLIRADRIKSGQRIVFGISGSGQTVGTALYTLDDLPDRMRQPGDKRRPRSEPRPFVRDRQAGRVRISAVGTVGRPEAVGSDAIELARNAAENCLRRSSHDRDELDLLIYAGVYRNDFLSEPAMAAILAGALAINADVGSPQDRKTFVFDVFNGAVGFLHSCHLASSLIFSRRFHTAMIATAEIENNANGHVGELRGLAEAGAALILEQDLTGKSGFGQFVFHYALEHIGTLTAHTASGPDGRTFLAVELDPQIEEHYLNAITGAVEELLQLEGLERSGIAAVIGPQISSRFTRELAERLGIAAELCVDAADERGDLLSCGFPYALHHLLQTDSVSPGDVALIISVGSGVQVGCAAYYF